MLITFFIWRIFTFIGEERVKIQQHITWVNIINFTGFKVNTNFFQLVRGRERVKFINFFKWREKG